MKKVYQATGKRKTAVSQVVLQKEKKPTKKKITIFSASFDSGTTLANFFPAATFKTKVLKPFVLTGTLGMFSAKIKVKGGGFSSQADATSYAIAKGLVKISPDHIPKLKDAKLLTRDSRVKERKKYGLKKARKAPQFSKR